MSFAALLLELSLTRLFSVVLFYHFAFLAISVALLGLGAGAVFAYLLRSKLARLALEHFASTICVLNAVVILAALEVVLHTPVSLQLEWGNFRNLTVLYLTSAVPFFLTGLLFSMVFARCPQRITQLYGADLLGGSAACLAFIPVLNLIGGPNAVVFAALAMAVAALVWAPGSRRILPGALALALLVLIGVNRNGDFIDVVYAKGIKREKPIFAKWNAISRIEVDRYGEGNRIILIDADASTNISRVDVPRCDENCRFLVTNTAMSAINILRPRGTIAIIGPGGGMDVMRAAVNGSPSVTAIDINPIIINDVMGDRMDRILAAPLPAAAGACLC